VEEPTRLRLRHALLRDDIVKHLAAMGRRKKHVINEDSQHGCEGLRQCTYPSQHSMIR
jgi:hypothetical protein